MNLYKSGIVFALILGSLGVYAQNDTVSPETVIPVSPQRIRQGQFKFVTVSLGDSIAFNNDAGYLKFEAHQGKVAVDLNGDGTISDDERAKAATPGYPFEVKSKIGPYYLRFFKDAQNRCMVGSMTDLEGVDNKNNIKISIQNTQPTADFSKNAGVSLKIGNAEKINIPKQGAVTIGNQQVFVHFDPQTNQVKYVPTKFDTHALRVNYDTTQPWRVSTVMIPAMNKPDAPALFATSQGSDQSLIIEKGVYYRVKFTLVNEKDPSVVISTPYRNFKIYDKDTEISLNNQLELVCKVVPEKKKNTFKLQGFSFKTKESTFQDRVTPPGIYLRKADGTETKLTQTAYG